MMTIRAREREPGSRTEVGALNDARRLRPDALVLVRRVADKPQPIERIPWFRPVPPG